MNLQAIGFDHHSAPLELREKLHFSEPNRIKALHELKQIPAINEAVILSTCQRTEIYTLHKDQELLIEWLAEKHLLEQKNLKSHLYQYQNADMVRHLMNLASGLDSIVLGEPQIFGQIKEAYTVAQQHGMVGKYFQKLFPTVFNAGKEVRTQTEIGAHPISIAYAIICLAQRIFSDYKQSSILLIGAGEIINLVATHFYGQGMRQLIIANRTLDRATELAEKNKAKAIALSEINNYLPHVDIVVSATASPVPILGKGATESAIKVRKHRPMLMIDLAVPRDIEPEISQLEDVFLYHFEDLQTIINENLKNRMEATKHARTIIETKVLHFMREVSALENLEIITTYRNRVEKLAAEIFNRAHQKLQRGQPPEEVLNSVQHNLLQKLLHPPTIRLRQAALEGDLELIRISKELFES